MMAFIIYPLITTAFFYLGSRAEITKFLWSRYPNFVDKLMSCAACAGLWFGVLVAILGGNILHIPFGTLPGDAIETYVTVGFCSTVWTPILAWQMDNALLQLGTPVVTEDVIDVLTDRKADESSTKE